MSKSLGAIVAAGVVGVIAWALQKEGQAKAKTQQVVFRREPDRSGVRNALVDVVFGALDGLDLDRTPATTWGGSRPSGGAQAVSGGGKTVARAVPPSETPGRGLKGLLDLIGSVEAPRGYDQVWGGIARRDHPPKPLTSMTIGEVLNWQDSIDARYNSEAAGRYQFMEDTLRDLVRDGKADPNERFDTRTQDRLAVQLMERRGLSDYRAGRINDQKFAQNLSKEWASLPAITRDKRGRQATGQSYYAGDGLNRSHLSKNRILAAVRDI